MSGPRRPPAPLIRWQLRHPFVFKNLELQNTGPLVAPMTYSVSGAEWKLGDHGEFAPTIQSEPIMITLNSTTAIDHGRRDGAPSTRLFSIGDASNKMPITASPRIIR